MKKRIALTIALIMAFTAVVSTLSLNAALEEWDASYSSDRSTVIKSGLKGQEVAKITIEGRTRNTAWTRGSIVFTLTDADGQALEGIKFSRITVDSDNTNIGRRDYFNDENHSTAESIRAERDRVYFNEYGNEVTITDVVVNLEYIRVSKIEVTFEVSPDIGFEGDVYISASSPGIESLGESYVENGAIAKVATVEPTFKAYINPYWQTVQNDERIITDDVIITEEDKNNLFKKGETIELLINRRGRGTPANEVVAESLGNDGEIVVSEGEMKITVNEATGYSAVLTVGGASTGVPSTIRIRGGYVDVPRSAAGSVYDLYVSGSALRDNGLKEFLSDGESISNSSAPGSTGTDRRDYFVNNGVVVENYIEVDIKFANNPLANRVTIFNDGSADVVINGVAGTMEAPTVNVDGSLYVPLRFIAYTLGATESDIAWDEIARTVTVRINDAEIIWIENSPSYVSNNKVIAMSNSAKACIINDRLYIPFRGFAEAFDIPVAWDAETQSATYNPEL